MSNDGNKMSNVKNTKPDAVLLGNAIVEARRKKKLTQQQLADALGVTNKTVSKWECGRGLPDQSMFLPLEQILEISVDDYVTEELSDGYTRTAKIISRVALISIAVILAISGILIIVSLTVTDPPVVAHECAHVCPICGGCTTDCADPVCVVKCNKHYDVEGTGVYVFEAEDCDYSDGLLAGNNLWMHSGDYKSFSKWKNSPTFCQALRESCHGIMYALANSSAVNGLTSDMEIVPVTNWWQHAIIALDVTFSVATAACVAMLVVTIVQAKKRSATVTAVTTEE